MGVIKTLDFQGTKWEYFFFFFFFWGGGGVAYISNILGGMPDVPYIFLGG